MNATMEAPVNGLGVVKFNITDAAIAELKEKYLPLKINGIEDKAGFEKVYKARQEVKKTRVALVKEADEMKESALAWQRKVNSEKNRVVGELESIEAHLQAEEDAVEAEKERIRADKEAAEKAKIQARIDAMAKFGFAIDYTLISSIDDESFATVLKNAEIEFEKEMSRRAEEEKALKLEQEKQEAERKELEELRKQRAEADRIIQQENERKEREERQRIEAEEKARMDKINRRASYLRSLGFVLDTETESYVFDKLIIPMSDLSLKDEEQFEELNSLAIEQVQNINIERKRKQKEHEAQLQKEAAEKALRDKEESDRLAKIAEEEKLASANDKVKWQSVTKQLSEISIPEMKSKKSRNLAIEVSSMIVKIKDFIQKEN